MMTYDSNILSGIKWSFIGHMFLGLLIIGNQFLFQKPSIRVIPTLKVDLVGLPDLVKKDLQSLTQIQSKREITKILKQAESSDKHMKASSSSSNQMGLNRIKNSHTIARKNKNALDRIKSLTKIQDHSDSDPKGSQPHLIQGNQISPGSSLAGEAIESSETSYHSLLVEHLHQNWNLPPWIARQNLNAQVQVYLDHQGHLKKILLVKSSGNSRFDEAVEKTLNQSQPFPPPPKELVPSLLNDGILLGFPL